MDVVISLSSKEHDDCSFDDLLSKQRTGFQSRIDSLRCTVEKFGERYRKQLNTRGLQVGRRLDDAPAWGWCSGRTADANSSDCWTTTSESDTDESVIEVCAATRKLRQTRGTQANTTRCSCHTLIHHPGSSDVSVKDAATQTLDCERITNTDNQLSDKVLSKQLLGLLETLAMQRPRNSRHRSLLKKTPVSSIERGTKSGQACISELLNRLQQQPTYLEDSIHGLLITDLERTCTRTDETDKSKIINRIAKHFMGRKLLGTEDKDEECGYRCLGAQHVNTMNTEEDYLENMSVHNDGDLWRLAEEGNLPWTCDLLKAPSLNGTDDDDNASTTTRMFYTCEVDSLFGPRRVFRGRKRCLPPWRWISVPPNLGVIPEYSEKHSLRTILTSV